MRGPQLAMLSVYDGQRCLGHIITRRGFEAFDLGDKSLGTFPTDHEAADAMHAAHLSWGSAGQMPDTNSDNTSERHDVKVQL